MGIPDLFHGVHNTIMINTVLMFPPILKGKGLKVNNFVIAKRKELLGWKRFKHIIFFLRGKGLKFIQRGKG